MGPASEEALGHGGERGRRKYAKVLLVLVLPGLAYLAWREFVEFIQPARHGPLSYYSDTEQSVFFMEFRLREMCAGAGVENTRDFFIETALKDAVLDYAGRHEVDLFSALVEVHTRSIYALIRHEYNVVPRFKESDDEEEQRLAQVFDPVATAKIRTSWESYVGLDSWGNQYHVVVGPWPPWRGPVLFRCYERKDAAIVTREDLMLPIPAIGTADALTVAVNGVERGLPADPSMDVYIWSFGGNGVSDQPLFDPWGEYAPPVRQHYRAGTAERYLGGGDDINNWDPGRSSTALYLDLKGMDKFIFYRKIRKGWAKRESVSPGK